MGSRSNVSLLFFQTHARYGPAAHLQQQEDQFPAARGNFSSLLSGMTLATKMVQAKIRRMCTLTKPFSIAWVRAKVWPFWCPKRTNKLPRSTVRKVASILSSSIRSTARPI
jgi:hypothetical protein